MVLSLFGAAVSLVENIRVGEECRTAGLGAEVDRPAAIVDAWKICRVRISEFSPTERYEARKLILLERIRRHTVIVLVSLLQQRLQTD
jgi:hypothetical protein